MLTQDGVNLTLSHLNSYPCETSNKNFYSRRNG